jgi:3-phosphoshikimate 1-carboxyvinyltransferase
MIALSASQPQLQAHIALPASKSESNRALVMQGLSGMQIQLDNLSTARDTQTMIRLLESEGHVLDVIDAGTTMRFLTAYFAVMGRDQILTGTPRMCKRPIGVLVDALRHLGAEIEYWKQEGFPPLHIVSKGTKMRGGELHIQGNVSSQFLSAILMVAPLLSGGLQLHIEGPLASRPYLSMTLDMMRYFGVESQWEATTIAVPEQPYQPGQYRIESDWSAASYWYSLVALADRAEVTLTGLRAESFQVDQHIATLMRPYGVETTYLDEGVKLQKGRLQPEAIPAAIDFTEVPDLAQTVAVVTAALGQPLRMTGLHTLRVKETDRITALASELGKFGVRVQTEADACTIEGGFTPVEASIATYEDHRMAMAFAPLALRVPRLSFNDPEVVVKSYPAFWQHLAQAGLKVDRW